MKTGQLCKRVLCISLSLWMNIVSEAGFIQDFSDMDWIKNSISEEDARTFCADIREVCDGSLRNVTSTQNSPISCDIVECCRNSSSVTNAQKSFSKRQPALNIHHLTNMCFAKWAYSEMLEDNHRLRSEAIQKMDKLMILERQSSGVKTRQKLKLAHDLKKIANGIVRSVALRSTLADEQYPSLEKKTVFKRSTIARTRRRQQQMTLRSVTASRCQMRMATVLARYAPNCVAKSILIWYCQGTCTSRSVPQYNSAISNVRSVEDCTCCSARTMRFRTLTFQCPGRSVPRRVAWPFDCSCRPCSSVPTMEETSSS
ncbi:hypothetical protein ElyMa_004696400 [Elysia marginata]|uniref:CTCK domain-containing protein n=1 Tax=Elysia marginata TaxID=1093978 RepID=A0AAV4IAH3_9GAST|nr:hypothetical protein ElyMa_004696400 [Elysia marginata]